MNSPQILQFYSWCCLRRWATERWRSHIRGAHNPHFEMLPPHQAGFSGIKMMVTRKHTDCTCSGLLVLMARTWYLNKQSSQLQEPLSLIQRIRQDWWVQRTEPSQRQGLNSSPCGTHGAAAWDTLHPGRGLNVVNIEVKISVLTFERKWDN